MPPSKVQPISTKVRTVIVGPLARRPISTRQKVIIGDHNGEIGNIAMPGKRKADVSPVKNDKVKRAALGNVTNAVLNVNNDDGKKAGNGAPIKPEVAQKLRDIISMKKTTQVGHSNNNTIHSQVPKPKNVENSTLLSHPNVLGPQRQTKVMTRAASRASGAYLARGDENSTAARPVKKNDTVACIDVGQPKKEELVVKPNPRRISTDFDQTETDESIYMSAHEDFSSSKLRLSDVNSLNATAISAHRKSLSSSLSTSNESLFTISNQSTQSNCDITLSQESATTSDPPAVPNGVNDFDRETWNDPIQASNYAMDIFNYLKGREPQFALDPYMHRQPFLDAGMRTLLVDWMVEVQETFELNHETLYLAVKIVDIYLSKVTVKKEKLQLLGAAAQLIASKYDERTPPLIDDFVFICDGAYKRKEITAMEINVFKTIGYDLGIPLSYRFLRRYARCAKVAMPELTLARYILEYSLMNYDVITLSDSKMAAACLYMSLRMSNKPGWNKTLEHFSGYTLSEFSSIIPILNASLHQKPRELTKTVRNKYAHKIFHEVSKIPLLTNEKLFENPGVPYP